jgi:hypothetical protein
MPRGHRVRSGTVYLEARNTCGRSNFRVVYQGRNRKLEFERADLRNFASCDERLGLREHDPVALVGFDLPSVGRVRLSDIDNEEFDLLAEAAMERFKVPSLGTERRSGIAAEDQSHRLAPAKGRELHLLGAA